MAMKLVNSEDYLQVEMNKKANLYTTKKSFATNY